MRGNSLEDDDYEANEVRNVRPNEVVFYKMTNDTKKKSPEGRRFQLYQVSHSEDPQSLPRFAQRSTERCIECFPLPFRNRL